METKPESAYARWNPLLYWWLLLTSALNENIDEPSDSARALAAAKAVLESLTDAYNYALCWSHQSDNVELAVSKTQSLSKPIACNHTDLPADYRRSQERTLLLPPVASASIFPTLSQYLRPRTWLTMTRLFLNNAAPNLIRETVPSWLERHVYHALAAQISKRRSNSRRVVIVSVHGWLPIKFARTVLGYSAGSARSLATYTADLVRSWLETDNPSFSDDEHFITLIALQGFDRVSDRVDTQYALMTNWLADIDSSDILIFVLSSHSTGVALEIMLRLLHEKCHDNRYSRKRVVLLAVGAGCLGPISGIDSRVVRRAYSPLEYEIINDFIDYSKTSSLNSRRMDTAVKHVLSHRNVRLALCAAIQDPFIPLTSALALHYSHPQILRTVYGSRSPSLAVPAFVCLLLEIVVTMANAGWSDGNLIIEDLSGRCTAAAAATAFTTPTTTGNGTATNAGHFAAMISDPQVYHECIRVALETTSLFHEKQLVVDRTKFAVLQQPNSTSTIPSLTWRLRCLLERLTMVNNVGNARLVRRVISEYATWIESPSGARVFRDAPQLFGALAAIRAEDLLV